MSEIIFCETSLRVLKVFYCCFGSNLRMFFSNSESSLHLYYDILFWRWRVLHTLFIIHLSRFENCSCFLWGVNLKPMEFLAFTSFILPWFIILQHLLSWSRSSHPFKWRQLKIISWVAIKARRPTKNKKLFFTSN